MGLNRIREDSVAELRKKKTLEQLQAENEQLRQLVVDLEKGKADKADVEAVWQTMAAAYSEGVESVG